MVEFTELAFSAREYDRRLDGARDILARLGVDALLLFDPSSICYLSGFTSVNLWDTFCLIVTRDAEPITVFRQFETERFAASSRFTSYVAFPQGGNCINGVADALRQLGLLNGTLAIEMSRHLHVRALNDLHGALPDANLREHAGMLDDLRLVKSGEEVAVMRKAAAITDQGISAGKAVTHDGASDYEICAETTRVLIAQGSDFMCIQPIVAVGARTGVAHSSTAGFTVGRGDAVFLEIGACVHRYTAPLMRTLLPSAASGELCELAELSSRTLDAMIAAMGPGVKAGEIARAGEQVLAPALSRIAFHFVWGYAVGIGFPPSWLEETGFLLEEGNHRELKAGMVFHLPMMLRIPGVCGAGSSETVLVTEHGAEVLSRLPRQFTI